MRDRDTTQLERLTFFSDAVFAIALTLLVIEVRPPHLTLNTDIALRDALFAMTPQYIGVLVSFVVIGRFWIGHHRAFGLVRRADRRVVIANLMLLCGIAFLPFPTAIVSEHAELRTGVFVYALWLIAVGLLNMRLMRLLLRPDNLTDDADTGQVRETRFNTWIPVTTGLIAGILATVTPFAALAALICAPILAFVATRWSLRARSG